jgi:hypothetical protein
MISALIAGVITYLIIMFFVKVWPKDEFSKLVQSFKDFNEFK